MPPTPPAPPAKSPSAATKPAPSIASRLAAEIYGLDILAEDVEDEAHNTTRFIVLAREPKWAEGGNGPVVTTFIFRVRNIPAALYKAMGGFATNGVNMTKLESYMIEGNFFATMFYADIEGHPDDHNVTLALKELEYFSKETKILGVYPAHPYRATFQRAGGVASTSSASTPRLTSPRLRGEVGRRRRPGEGEHPLVGLRPHTFRERMAPVVSPPVDRLARQRPVKHGRIERHAHASARACSMRRATARAIDSAGASNHAVKSSDYTRRLPDACAARRRPP